jgi:hypothetical protein
MIKPDKFGILLAKPPGVEKGKWFSGLLAYMLTGPWWWPYEMQPKGSRNSMVAAKGNDLYTDLMEMQEAGLVVLAQTEGDRSLFIATEKSMEAMQLDKTERLRAIKTARLTKGGRLVYPKSLRSYSKDPWPPHEA